MFHKPNAREGRILIFDVNETLLDVKALRPHFEHLFKDPSVLKEWFAQVLLYSQTITQAGEYWDFATLARAALQMVCQIRHVDVAERDIDRIVQSMRSLPAHPEVHEALEQLVDSGFRIVVLTNSAEHIAREQLGSSGLAPLFERVFSIDAVKKYKPAADAYRHVARELGVNTSELTMIAAHPWDLIGAKAAGCEIAFIQRPGTAWFPLTAAPAVTVNDAMELAERLIEDEEDRWPSS